MNIKSIYRGHEVACIGGQWFYTSNMQSIQSDLNRECSECKCSPGDEGHDQCLGKLVGLMAACCGHGEVEKAYVQFLDGINIYGVDAKTIQEILKKYNK